MTRAWSERDNVPRHASLPIVFFGRVSWGRIDSSVIYNLSNVTVRHSCLGLCSTKKSIGDHLGVIGGRFT